MVYYDNEMVNVWQQLMQLTLGMDAPSRLIIRLVSDSICLMYVPRRPCSHKQESLLDPYNLHSEVPKIPCDVQLNVFSSHFHMSVKWLSCDEYGAVDGADVGSWEPELEFKTRCAPPSCPPQDTHIHTHLPTSQPHPPMYTFSLLPSCLVQLST